MAGDRDIVKQLQRHLGNWNPDGQCTVHPPQQQCCEYDEQGRLIKLHLCALELVQVPSEAWQCLSLEELALDNNQLGTLPAELGQLAALEELSLTNNQFSTLPAEIGQLAALERLWLSNNQFSTLPVEVGQLAALEELWLTNNQFSTLPVEVGQLAALETLSLANNRLSTLPAEIGQLAALERLYLSNNRLSILPEEVGNLSALEWLDLSNNQFSILPAEVGQLSSLQTLALHNNQLSTLPAEVGQLSSLELLSLANNRLSTLPAEVGNLSALEWLDLSNNQLSTLPAEVGQLSSLQTLDMHNNPLQSPLPKIIAQGIPAILAYLRTLQPIKIFYCYAHEDKDLRDQIDKHLGVLKRLGHVVGWYDREIQAGTEWEREIEGNLRNAHIILLLVSADFVASDYCYGVEMKKALELHRRGQVRVLPILLRPVDWQDAPFATLQMLPTGAKPVTKWNDPEEALEDVARQIRAVVNTLRTRQS